MAAKKPSTPVTYPRVVIAGATRSKLHGRRGSPYNPKPRFARQDDGEWDTERVRKHLYGHNWDHKGMKSDGALAFTKALKGAGPLLCLEVAISVVPRTGYDGYLSRRDLVFGLLRGALVEADDATWEQANAFAEEAWKEDNARVRRALACLFPHREDWGRVAAEELLAEYEALAAAKGYAPATYEILDSALVAGAGASPALLLKLVALGFWEFTPQSEPWLIDMAERLGADAAPLLAAFHRKQPAYHDYYVASARLLTIVQSVETAEACAERLGDWKKLNKTDVKYLKSAPSLAIPALEAEVKRYKKSSTRGSAHHSQRSAGAARAEALLKEILAEHGAAAAPAFDRSKLPEGLRTSPWSASPAKKPRAASFKGLEVLPYPPRVVMDQDTRDRFQAAEDRRLAATYSETEAELLARAIAEVQSPQLYGFNQIVKHLSPEARLAAYEASPDATWKKTRHGACLGERLLHALGPAAADVSVRVLKLCIYNWYFEDAVYLIDPRLAPRNALFASQKKHRYKALPLLTRDLEASIIGLVHGAVTEKGSVQKACVAALKELALGEQEALLDDVLARYGDAVTARVNALLERGVVAPKALPAKAPKMPAFFSPASLPPLTVGGAALPLEVVREIGELMKASQPSPEHRMIQALLTHVSAAERRAFCEAVMAQWVDGGGAPAEAWASTWMGVLGGDEGLEYLAEQLELWCRGNRHHRAFAALEAFVAHPSDRSAALVDRVARRSGFDGLSTRARQAVHRLAESRGLPSEVMLDRVVPDCGLSGVIALDYGTRSFTAGFDAGLRPWVKGGDGKLLKEAPQPGKKDGPGAGAARARWMSVKAAVRGQSREQLQRLERALVQQRRWSAEAWAYYAAHPLLGLLARGVVWGDYGGALSGTFRVDESGAAVTVTDEPYTPAGAVGVVHPVQLDAALLKRWGGVFADYELVQPFAQLQRPRLTAAEAPALAAQLEGVRVPPGALLALRRRGWARAIEEQGFYDGLDGSALAVRFEPGLDVVTSATSDEPRTLEVGQYADNLAEMDPVTVSEELALWVGLLDRAL